MQSSALEPDPIVRQRMAAGKMSSLPAENGRLNAIAQWVFLTLLAAMAYLLVSRGLLQIVQVEGQSMLPTLRNADRYYLNRLTYYLHPPNRGDVVVLKDPSDGNYAVKRIIGLAGDAIHLKSGRVYVNGEELVEPYLPPHTLTSTCIPENEELILCGRDQYFVLGDNRNNSFDSRIYGPVPRRNIVGELIR